MAPHACNVGSLSRTMFEPNVADTKPSRTVGGGGGGGARLVSAAQATTRSVRNGDNGGGPKHRFVVQTGSY